MSKKRRMTKAERRRRQQRKQRIMIACGAIAIVVIVLLILHPWTGSGGKAYDELQDSSVVTTPDPAVTVAVFTPTETPAQEPTDEPTAVPTQTPTQQPEDALPEDVEQPEVEEESDQLAAETLSYEAADEDVPMDEVIEEDAPEDEAVSDGGEKISGVRYITITATGDCTLGGDTNGSSASDARFAKIVDSKGYDYFFENFRELFESDDFTIVNFEGTLATSNSKNKKEFNFRGKPEYTQILTGSGVEVCNLANNHSMDFKKAGLMETAETLQAAGLGVCGYTVEYYAEKNGVTVGFLGFTQWRSKSADMVRQVSAAREKCDILIVSYHGGEEYGYSMTKKIRKLGESLVDAGADLIIGNHSHVYGEIYRYKGKYIIYSLGNFCFGGNTNPRVKDCIVFQQTFGVDENGTVSDAGINIIPASISGSKDKNDCQPRVLTGSAGADLLSRVAALSNLTADTLWMDTSYEVQNGIVEQTAA